MMQVRIRNWKPFQRGSLQGFASICLPSGLVLHDCAYHERADRRWVYLPSRRRRLDDGIVSWQPLIEFADRSEQDKFDREAVMAIREHLGGDNGR